MAGYRQQFSGVTKWEIDGRDCKAFTSRRSEIGFIGTRRIHLYSKWRTKSIMGSRRGAANFEEGAGRGSHRSDVICSTFGWLKNAGVQIEYGKKLWQVLDRRVVYQTGNEPHILHSHLLLILNFKAQRENYTWVSETPWSWISSPDYGW